MSILAQQVVTTQAVTSGGRHTAGLVRSVPLGSGGRYPVNALSSPSDSPAFEPRIGRSVSIDQASQLLGVSRRTVYNWIRAGRLQTIRTIGGSQRVVIESLRDCLSGHTRSAGPLVSDPVWSGV